MMDRFTDMTPEDRSDLRFMEGLADTVEPRPEFESRLEAALNMEHKRPPQTRRAPEMLRFAGWAVAILALALFLNWLIGSLAPVQVPAGVSTPTLAPDETTTSQTPVPNPGQTYEWRGTTLTINAALPSDPAEASVFQTQPETPGTIESAQALAARFGLQGSAYLLPEGSPGSNGFLITDGKQRLYYSSEQSFTYHPDYPAFLSTSQVFPAADAEALIADFLSAHGLDFPYRVQPSEFYGGYYAIPLAEDGLGLRFEYFQYAGLLFRFNASGIVAVEAKLVDKQLVGVYSIRSAQEALDWLLASEGGSAGIQEGMHSPTGPFDTWYRQYPDDTTITLYAQPPFSFASADGSAPLVTLDGYPLLGAGQLPEGFSSPNMVRAIGRFTRQNEVRYFQVDSWELFSSPMDGLQGTLQQQDGQGVLLTIDGETLSIPDLPAGLDLPMESVYVLGYRDGSVFHWSSIDTRMTMGGGGGGGGGLGLYTLNLSGTPIPFSTATPFPTAPPFNSGFPYTVVAGDTFASVAQAFGLTSDELMRFNGITDPSTLFIGQTLMIPQEQRSDGWQGVLTVTILKSPDGSERTQYSFLVDGGGYYQLAGDLAGLSAYNNRPIKVWGPIQEFDPAQGMVITVERYEVPYPDLTFQILHGRQSNQTLEGELLTLLTTTEDQTYVVLFPDGSINSNPVEPANEDVIVEALAIPGETYMGYPALRIFSAAMAINPKTGNPSELTITADQPQVIEDQPIADFEVPTLTIESVQLIYYTKDTSFQPTSSPGYVQPMWLFTGHYSNGEEFEFLVQALRDEFLSPEIEPIEPPG